jgi:fibronectin-binding autotransporter adhesin
MFIQNRFSVPSTSLSSASFRLACVGVIAGIAAATTPCTASAGTLSTWTGGGGNGSWSTAANWIPTTPSTTGDFDLVFGGTAQGLGAGTIANPRVVTTDNTIGTVNVSSIQFINSGTLTAGQNAFFRINGSTLVLNSATISTVAASGGQFVANSDGDTIAAPMTLSGTSTIITNNLHNLSLAGNMSGTGGVIYDDGSANTTEFVYVSGSNGYTGGTLIRGGFVQTGARVDSVTGLATTSNNFAFGSGPVTVSENGTLLLRNNSIISNSLTVSGSGSGSNPANNSALVGSFGVAGQTAEYRGDITLAGDARFSTASSAIGDTTSKLLVSGNVNLGSNLLTLRSRPANSGGTLGMLIEITGTIAGSGGVNVESLDGLGRALISGSNSYSGGTTVTTGTLIVGSSSALGTGFLAVNTSGLDLNGQTLFVGPLSGSSAGVILSGTSGAARLVTTSTTTSTYAGTIIDGSGTVGLTKAGSGLLSLTGSNGYTGVTNIDGGVLAVDSGNAINGGGDITFGGGTLRYSAANQVDYSAQFKQSTAAISIDTNGQTVSYNTAIANTNAGGLTKTGSGTLYLNAANQYAGTTTVNAGTLTGTGSVLGLLAVQPGAVFDPGSSPTATTIFGVGSFSQATGGTTRMQVNGTTAGLAYDQVLFSGTSKTVSWGGLLDLTLSGSYANYTEFNLFSGFTSYTGDLSGISFTAPGSPYSALSFNGPVGGVWSTGTTEAGQYMTFNQTTGVLAVVPEPTAVALAAVGVAICGLHSFRRRRRPVSE